MKRCIGTFVCSVALLGAGMGSSQAALPQAKTAAATSDSSLRSRIDARIEKDPTLKKYDIGVTVEAGVATLTGTVPTEADRAKAGELAMMKGVARVDNKLLVDLAATAHPKGTTGKVMDKTKEVGEKTKEGAEKAVDKGKEGLSKTGEVITDSWITTRVKGKFVGDDLMKGSDVSVSTDNHIVTLTGTVMSAAARAHAVAEAKQVEGVHRIVDKLTIGPKK